jgi:ABC-type antimicrobial peptide transport system permease subunit
MIHLYIFEHLQNAYASLRATRLRTLLTTLGVAIGVASVTTILALSGGVTKVVSSQVSALGGNMTVVRPGVVNRNLDSFANPTIEQTYTTSTITEQDVATIKAVAHVTSVAPLMILNNTLHSTADNKHVSSTVIATTPDLATVTELPIQTGQFLDPELNRDSAVIGSQLSINLFGTTQSIGQTFTIRGQTFTVIGVLKYLNNPINYNAVDFDNAALITLDSGKAFHQGIAQIQQIDIRADSTAALPGVMKEISLGLSKNHQGEKDFTVLSGKDISQPTSRFFLAITSVMTAIAAIALFVGGIGIMNIMLVGVAERTREIGLRKSVGASSANIAWQFLVEALILSLVGGLIGYVGGYFIAFAISTVLPFNPVINWQITAISLGMAVCVGAIFGLYPAIRAARKDPIESLRQYH